MTQVTHHRFEVDAPASVSWSALPHFFQAVSAAILAQVRGLVIHTAAISYQDRALLFIGPSEAGKTTAARHCEGATLLAHDRGALVSHRDNNGGTSEWRFWPLAGGSIDDQPLPWRPHADMPVAAILRVRQAERQPRLVMLDAMPAVLAVRESVQSGAQDSESQTQLIQDIAELCQAVTVADVHTVLGVSLQPLIEGLVTESK